MTDELPHNDHELLQACHQVIQHLMEQFEWSLLSEDELVAAVLPQINTMLSGHALKQLAIHTYAIKLYDACRQHTNPTYRDRAYTDLFRFLYRFAYSHSPERADEVVNQTLLVVYEQIDECREPGAFLRFAWWKLRAALKKAHQETFTLSFSEETEPSLLPTPDNDPEIQILREEQLHMLVASMDLTLSVREQRVVILTYFGGYSDREISQRLDVSPANVRVIRHRALDKLRRHLRPVTDSPDIA